MQTHWIHRRIQWVDRVDSAWHRIWHRRPRFLRAPVSPWAPLTATLICVLLGIGLLFAHYLFVGMFNRLWPDSWWRGRHTVIGTVPIFTLALGAWTTARILRRSRRDFFAAGWRLGPVALFAFGSLFLGLWGSVWCFDNHVCMGGHMDHPPYQA